MRNRSAALAAACMLTPLGGCAATAASAPMPKVGYQPPVVAMPSPVHGCQAAADLVEPFRTRAILAGVAGDTGRIRRELYALAKDADAAYRSPAWRRAMGACRRHKPTDPRCRRDVVELRRWGREVSSAMRGLSLGDDPERVIDALAFKLGRAITLTY
ncbi:hypothetical protein ACIBG8_09415 [Nonomuraea sp. NPDC050556]|uniref:hypothetical protein n=1 Tax=Nonomuraea sp. NPDC050556 TaxID=3364369 RepID=UPI0037ABEA49